MADGSLAKRALTGAGWLIAWRMVARSLGFLSTLVLARLLVPADFGLVAMATTFAGAIDSLSQFSVEDMLVRRVEDDTRLHDAAFTLQVGRAVLTGGLIAAGAPWAAAWFHEPRLIPVLLVLGGLAALAGLENIGLVAFRRELRFDVQFRISLLPRVLQVLTTIAVAWEWRTYWALLAGMAVTRVARLVMTYVVHPYRPRFGLRGWRELAGFSAWLWAASLARLVWDRYDAFLIGPAFGAASLGLYQIALAIALLPVSELVAPVADVLLAGFSAGQRQGSRAVDAAAPLGLAALVLLTPIVLTLSAGAGDVVRIMLGGAARWAPAAPLIAVVSMICLIAPVGYVVRAAMVARGLVRQEFVAMTAATLVRLWLIWFAVKGHALPIVAVAAFLCALVETGLFCFQLGRHGALGMRRASGSALRVGLVGVATALLLRRSGLAWGRIAAGVGLGAAVLHLTVLGLLAGGFFWGGVALLWWVAGRPQGAEQMLLSALRHAVAPLRARGRRLRGV